MIPSYKKPDLKFFYVKDMGDLRTDCYPVSTSPGAIRDTRSRKGNRVVNL